MGKTITIHRGYDIKLKGAAEKTVSDVPVSDLIAIKPPDFHHVTPKMLLEPGDEVLAGQALFYDKNRPELRFPSSLSGEVVEVVRGEKRRIMEVRVLPDKGGVKYVDFPKADPETMSREAIIARLLESGCWNYIRQRPYTIIANPEEVPKGIFVSCFDSAPLAPNLSYIAELEMDSFQTGLMALKMLCNHHLHLGMRTSPSEGLSGGDFTHIPVEHLHQFKGPHPSGNVGIQIHHIDPIQKGEVVWYVHPQDVIIIGRLFLEGRYRADRMVAFTGSSVEKPHYLRMISGQNLSSVFEGSLNNDHSRIIQGNVLTGKTSHKNDFLSFYENQITVIPEGDQSEFLGWLMPGFKKLSLSKTYFSWLFPKRNYQLDTNLHGEARAFVMTGQYDRVLPMNIYPVILLKAILANDIERMEELGIYEIAEEDFALCEFVCTSKIEVQKIVSEGLEMMREEA